MSPARVLAEFSCTDFVDAVQWLHDRWNDPPVECHYMAGVIHELRLMPFKIFGPPEGGRPLPKFKDAMIKFVIDKKPEADEPETEKSLEDKLTNTLKDVFGMSGGRKKVKPQPPPKPKLKGRKGKR
jgi:hypothetical protein